MTARPIIFSAPMIRALLAGEKTIRYARMQLMWRYPEDSLSDTWTLSDLYAKVSGAGTASAGLPGYTAGTTE